MAARAVHTSPEHAELAACLALCRHSERRRTDSPVQAPRQQVRS
ncbi:hypothetical protein AVMA1855_00435 [Acidovorax sp. SUPP1855]|nr:hypothetical protein [Acidovorax sp. SUPP1855]GKS82561.1 hypothetical protein AVMA1855_00435 [Acidovorax sp. SUPP1855]